MIIINGNNVMSELEFEVKNMCLCDLCKVWEKDWLVFNIVQCLIFNRKFCLYYVQVNKFLFDIRGKKFFCIIFCLRKFKVI